MENHAGDPEKSLKCPECGWTDVRRSKTRGVIDRVVRMAGLVPYRCRSCGRRFYRAQPSSPPAG